MQALSYSFIRDYLNCPYKVYRTKIAKDIPFVSSREIEWGNKVHEAFETAIKKEADLPREMPYQGYLNALRRLGKPLSAEVELSVNEQLKPVEWFSKLALYRGKIDVLIKDNNEAVLVDWKTGNSKYEDKLELDIQAFILKIYYPELTNVTGYYVWLKDKKVGQKYLLNDWNRTHRYLTDIQDAIKVEKWYPKPNALCAYCPVSDCKWNKRVT